MLLLLENREAGDDRAIGQMGGALYVILFEFRYRQPNFGLENFHELLYTVLLCTQPLKRLEDFFELRGSLVICESVDILMYVLSHGFLH